MNGTTTYNLLDEPWILALDLEGELTTVSLRQALMEAHLLRRLVGELPSQEVAVLRLLLAILHRALAVDGDDEDARVEWGHWWAGGRLPHDRVADYLGRYADRFDLVHPEHPFMQVADLRTASGKTSGLSKMIAEVPAGHRFFSTRTHGGVTTLDFAEAARWLVHVQAFDASGIKTGAVGDQRVKGGRGYPIGIGWTGNLGLVVLEGETLLQTLLLNLVLHPGSPADDEPPWETPPMKAAASGHDAPWGPAQAMTWQIRRVRLIHDGAHVHDALISNGDPVRIRNQHGVETMTGFRRSPTQEAQHKEPLVYMARLHSAGRAIWRGLESLIAGAPVSVAVREPSQVVVADNVSWVAGLRHYEILDRELPTTMRTVGVVYGSNNSVIDTVLSDQLRLRISVLGDRALQRIAVDAARNAQMAARVLGRFAGNLALAEGREPGPQRDRGEELGLGMLDRPFRSWVADLSTDTRDAADRRWRQQVHHLVRRLALTMHQQASQAALRGRVVEDRNGKQNRIDAAVAHAWFIRQLATEVPLEPAPEEETSHD